MVGNWAGSWGGSWLGGTTPDGNPIVIAALHASGAGHAFLTATLFANPAPPPGNGPSGGVSWLRGYAPKFDYSPKPPRSRRARRNEILFLAPKV